MARKRKPAHKGRNVLFYTDSERDADLRYATHFHAGDPFIFLRTRTGRRHLFVTDLERDRARGESSAHVVHRVTEFVERAREKFGARTGIAETLFVILSHFRLRRVAVPGTFPVATADQLRGLGVRIDPLASPVFPERLIKRPDEVREISRACRATERGLEAGIDVLRKSRILRGYLVYDGRRLTSERLRAIIDTTILQQGYLPAGTIVASGVRGCDPHDRGAGPIRANEPVIIDVFPRSATSGYFADITRTVVRGRASRQITAMYRAVHEAQRRALRAIRHGVRGDAVHRMVQAFFVEMGFETGQKAGRMQGFFHGTGHGLGLEIHEMPRIGLVRDTLPSGAVVTVEPGLYYRPHGGVRIEDTVLVTRTGVRMLTRFPKTLEI